jgi:hypothetical protein
MLRPPGSINKLLFILLLTVSLVCTYMYVQYMCVYHNQNLRTHLGPAALRDILDTVRCAVRELGMRNIWYLSVLLSHIRSRFQHLFRHGCTMSSFMNQDAQRDVVYFITDCLQFHLENAPSV